MRKAFTMIELIFVIVILGILAVVAVPKFINVSDDAKIAAEQGVAGGIRSGIAVARGAALVANPSFGSNTYATVTKGNISYNVNTAYNPINLDSSTATANTTTAATASSSAPFFGVVLNDPISDTWTRAANAIYKGPASLSVTTGSLNTTATGWQYLDQSGTFVYQP